MKINYKSGFACPTCGRDITAEDGGGGFPSECRRCKTVLTSVVKVINYAERFFTRGCNELKNRNFPAAMEQFRHSLNLKYHPETEKALAIAMICAGEFHSGLVKLKHNIQRV